MMSTEDHLKELILRRYDSLKAFSDMIGLPNSTVVSILQRGVLNAKVDNVITICNALNISADALAEGKIVHNYDKPTPKTQEVSDILERVKLQLLDNEGLMFNGKPADQESINSILSAMEIGMEIAKRKRT